jgi:4'-phosphopantetheinyl transferase
MFRWTISNASEHEALCRAEAPPAFLSPQEEAALSRLAFPMRRRKWLLGRWAAKRVLREVLAEKHEYVPALTDITIANQPSGAPYALIEGQGRVPWSLSISHRIDVGFAAVASSSRVAVGADVELVVPRDPALVRGFFTGEEAAAVDSVRGREVDLAVARIWSAKEAVLKAMGLGLRLDTRTVQVLGESPEEDGAAPAGWRRLRTSLSRGRDNAGAPRRSPARDVTVFWRDEGEYVLTIALMPSRRDARAPAHLPRARTNPVGLG